MDTASDAQEAKKAEIIRELKPSELRLFIATPCYPSMYHAEYLTSLVNTISYFTAKGLPVHWHGIHNQIIHKARDYLAWYFLNKTDATHMLFIDDDMQWEPQAVERLLLADKDVVAAVGRRKIDREEFACHLFNPLIPIEDYDFHQDPETGLLRIYSVGTAFMMIKRQVIEHMYRFSGDRMYCEKTGSEPGVWMANLFPIERAMGAMWSEDYGFCRLWHDFNGEIWLDPLIKLGHIGRKNYEGTPLNFIKEKYDERNSKRDARDRRASDSSTAIAGQEGGINIDAASGGTSPASH